MSEPTAMVSPPNPDDIVSPTDTISPSSNPAAAPSNTITPTHFQHKTMSAAVVHPYIDTAQPPLNSVPIELDSTPLSTPVSRHGSWKTQSNLRSEEPIIDGLIQAGDAEPKIKKADELRQDNPAVLAGPPDIPAAEDFEAAKLGDGLVTPS